MKFSPVLLLVAAQSVFAQGGLFERAACNADNCYRAVAGTVAGQPRSVSRVMTDCMSYAKVTVFPTATTITTSSGSVSTTITAATADTTVKPSNIPGYATSSCGPSASVASRFASACSCAGYPMTTTTAAQPTATVVVPTGAITCSNPFNRDTSTGGSDAACGNCDCFARASGPNFCAYAFCTSQYGCTNDSECPSGQVCAKNVSCSAENSCVTADFNCANTSSPSRLFRRSANGAKNAAVM